MGRLEITLVNAQAEARVKCSLQTVNPAPLWHN